MGANGTSKFHQEFHFRRAGDFIVAQDKNDPERVIFYWAPGTPVDYPLYSLTRAFADEHPPNLVREVHTANGDIRKEEWGGAYWTDEMDHLLRSLAEAFIELRFSSPDRTRLIVQDTLWPEMQDG